ncbi:MAG: Omp28-related outer membrane protein [Prevotella sp.]|jgi:hypothetical protein
MKKNLLLLVAFVMALAANAQNLSILKAPTVKAERFSTVTPAQPKAFQTPRKVDLADNQRLMGNYTSDTYAGQQEGVGLPNYPGTYSIVGYIPASVVTPFDGKSLVSIRFALASAATVNSVVIYGYTTSGSIEEITSQDLTSTSCSAGWTTVSLTTPWTIDMSNYQALMMGYEYVQTSSGYPLSFVDEGDVMPSYVYGDLGQGEGFYDIGAEQFGNLSVQAIVEGEYAENSVTLKSISADNFVKIGDKLNYTVNAYNFGSKVANYDLQLSIDGTAMTTVSRTNLAVGASEDVTGTLDIPTDFAAGSHTLTATITKVNDADPDATVTTELSTNFTAYKDVVDRQYLTVEHFTSNSCTYCYLGEKLLSSLYTKRSDLAHAAIHGTMNSAYPDPTTNSQCDSIMSYMGVSSYPSGTFNRANISNEEMTSNGIAPEGYLYGLGYYEQYIEQVATIFDSGLTDYVTNNPSFVTLSVQPVYDEATKKLTLNIKGEGVEGASSLLNGYKLNVYLCEDSVKFNQYTNGSWVSNDNHNDVFRTALPSVKGNDINWNGDNFEVSYSTTLNSSWVANQMKYIVFVAPDFTASLNAYDVNQAIQGKIIDPTGIQSVTTDAASNTVVARYNAAGQQINGPQKGINIIKYADGTSKKVIVK